MQNWESRQSKLGRIAPYSVAFGMFLILLIVTSYPSNSWMSGITKNYLSVHIVLELVGILVSFAIFTVGWATYQNARDSDILVLSTASFGVGMLDLGHTLSFTGMPDFFGPSGPEKAIAFWFASRITASLAFFYVSLSRPRATRFERLHWILFAGILAWAIGAGWVILEHESWLPVFFVGADGRTTPTQGLTGVKILIEWSIVILSFITGFFLFLRAERQENVSYRWMGCSCLLYGMCGYFFTIYNDFDDLYNFAGHCFKAMSYLLLYRAVFIECISRPYSHLELLAKEALAANSSKSRFLANVSHEFRTPLGVISGFSELLIGSGRLDANLLHWSETIARNAKQLSLLIDDLLDLAKAENDRIEIRPSRFDVADLMRQMIEAFDVQTHGKPLTVKFRSALPSPVWVVTDELRLRQILTNLIGNAVKFTAAGSIEVSLHLEEQNLFTILVCDTGLGIAEKDVAILFQPFAQVSNSENRKFGGTGLGLSLSRRLAELLGGTLTLLRSKPGEGSVFQATFRDQSSSSSSESLAVSPPVKATAPDFTGQRVLIAEDSKDNQLLLRNYLKPTGISIVFADNGADAVSETTRQEFSLILMDIQMPIMDGFEATIQLRKNGWPGQILALTAHVHQPERDRAMRNGFNAYLVKPINKEQLWQSMAEAFTR